MAQRALMAADIPELGALAGRTALAAVRKQLPHGSLVSAPIGELFTAENTDRYRPWSERARPLDVQFYPVCGDFAARSLA